jgi:hypothetical protein
MVWCPVIGEKNVEDQNFGVPMYACTYVLWKELKLGAYNFSDQISQEFFFDDYIFRNQWSLNFLQIILPIVVFGGLGLGALAFVDSINYRTRLCNKVSFHTN